MNLTKKAITVISFPLLLGCTGVFLAFSSHCNSTTTEGNISCIHHPSHYPGLETVMIPDTIPSQIKEYTGFTLSFNKTNHTPNYVAWELLGKETTGETNRYGKFWVDKDIVGSPLSSDYTRSGYDRGHICPSGDQKWSEEAMRDCFATSNITPQVHALNNGAWKTLETKERYWAQRDSAIVIVAGPVYSPTDNHTIGSTRIRVPGAYFKAFLAPYVEEPRAIAFIYPNSIAPGNMQEYAMSIDTLEEITGFDLFSALPDSLEISIEASFSFKEWNKTK